MVLQTKCHWAQGWQHATMSDKLTPNEHELLNAYVDGELSADEHLRVESQLDQRPELRAAVADLEALRELFQRLPPQTLPGQFVDRVMSSAERTMLLGEQAMSTGPTKRQSGTFTRSRMWLVTALAASVVALLLIPICHEIRLARAPVPARPDSPREPLAKLENSVPPPITSAAPHSDLTSTESATRMEVSEISRTVPPPTLDGRLAGGADALKRSAEVAGEAPVNEAVPSGGIGMVGDDRQQIADQDSVAERNREDAVGRSMGRSAPATNEAFDARRAPASARCSPD